MSQYGYLAHHGIKGQKWGIRRYQNADGSLTAEGRERYRTDLYKKENRDLLYKNEGFKAAYNRFSDARQTVIKENLGPSLKEDEKDSKAFSLLKKDIGEWDALRGYYAYKTEIERGRTALKNIAGVLSAATIGFGTISTGGSINYYKDRYKKATESFIEELEAKDRNKYYNNNKINAQKAISENIDHFYKNGGKEKVYKEVLSKINPDPKYGISIHDVWDNVGNSVSKGLSDYLGLKSDEDKRAISNELIGSYDKYMNDITNHIRKKIKDKGINIY